MDIETTQVHIKNLNNIARNIHDCPSSAAVAFICGAAERLRVLQDRLTAAESGIIIADNYVVQLEKERDQLRAQLAAQTVPAESVPYVPFLSNRADGVDGHYAIGRFHHEGYFEYWHLKSRKWASCSDDVLTKEQAIELLKTFSPKVEQVSGGGEWDNETIKKMNYLFYSLASKKWPELYDDEKETDESNEITKQRWIGFCLGIKQAQPSPNKADVPELVNRFLSWPLPLSIVGRLGLNKVHNPIGTLLLNSDEAKNLIEYLLPPLKDE